MEEDIQEQIKRQLLTELGFMQVEQVMEVIMQVEEGVTEVSVQQELRLDPEREEQVDQIQLLEHLLYMAAVEEEVSETEVLRQQQEAGLEVLADTDQLTQQCREVME
jgi:hypothetical protein